MKQVILILSLVAGASAFAHNHEGKEKMQAARAEENAKVKAACSAEVAATGCAEDLGKGLMKCMHAYHQGNKDFKVSEGCHNVVKETREMRHDRHEDRKAKRAERRAAKKAGDPVAPANPSN